jgi:hypothetical protein
MIKRDVSWQNKNYGEYYGTISPKTKQYNDSESSSDEEIQIINHVKNKEERLESKRKLIPESSIIAQSKAIFLRMKKVYLQNHLMMIWFLLQERSKTPTYIRLKEPILIKT